MKNIKITYSWGDEEEIITCKSEEEAWARMKELAINESEVASEEHGCEIGLTFDRENGNITLHYTYDNEYCYYNLCD